jgi:class 3 adenylate cyclase/tetratricopeptide (TPR) repeat protein/ribosomal protein L40E
MRCRKCETENLADSTFCVECGAKLESGCPACGSENPQSAKFCRKCGTALVGHERTPDQYTPAHLAEKILSSKAALLGERKQVTVLFADVKGSMDLQEQLDTESWSRIMDRFFTLLCEGVHRYEGTVNKFTGDGIMALFGAPISHEDHSLRACYAGLQITKDVGEYAKELRRDQGLSFSVRLGINSGEVVLGTVGDDLSMDYTALGQTVGLASRVEGLAEPGRVYITEHTAALVSGFFEMDDLGVFSIKGVREPVRVFEIKGVGAIRTRLDLARARGFSRFVGRHAEQRAIEEALTRTAEGHGQIVGIVGEPGLGKSRLCYEFAERCRTQGLSVREAHGVAHGKSVPYLPVLEMLRGYFGITDHDNDQEAREKIAGRLVLLDRTFEQSLPLLFDFLGIPDPTRPAPRMGTEARQRQLHAMVKRLVQLRSSDHPSVLVFEDLHWIDPGSQGFVDAIVEALPGTHTLVLANFRPEYHAPWTQKTYYRGIPLQPLDPDDMREMLEDLLGSDPSLNGLADLVMERTVGNPFFIEEVVFGLVESGGLDGAKGRYRLTRTIEDVKIPATVEAMIAARIDLLTDPEKALLQTASVIGKEFSLEVLMRVADSAEEELAGTVDALVRSEFVYEAALYPEIEYAFRHPLIQEVAYRSQLAERRSKVHRAVATAITEIYAGKLDERAALLAHHWEGAGETLQAAQWHLTAAGWVGRTDHLEALRHLRAARSLLEAASQDAATEGMLLVVLMQILYHGWRIGIPAAEAASAYSGALALSEKAGDPFTSVITRASYAAVKALAGDIAEALALSHQAWDQMGKGPEFEALRLTMLVNLSYLHFITGDADEALKYMEEGLRNPPEDPTMGIEIIGFSPYIWLVGMRGYHLGFMGHPEEIVPALDHALRLAQENGDLEVQGWLHGMYTGHVLVTGTLDHLGNHTQQAAAIAERIGSAFSRVLATWVLGLGLRMKEEWPQAAGAFERSLEIARERGVGIEQTPLILAQLAQAYTDVGDDRDLSVAQEALSESRRLGTANGECEALMALARARLRAEGPERVGELRALLEEALQVMGRSGYRSFAPRIHLLLAELDEAIGDGAARERDLEEAYRIASEIGATGYAKQAAEQLARV